MRRTAMMVVAVGLLMLTLCAGTALAATLSGAAAGDHIEGTGGADLIHGLGGDDAIHGLAGNDLLYATARPWAARNGRDTGTIHRSAWKDNSPKSAYGFLHTGTPGCVLGWVEAEPRHTGDHYLWWWRIDMHARGCTVVDAPPQPRCRAPRVAQMWPG